MKLFQILFFHFFSINFWRYNWIDRKKSLIKQDKFPVRCSYILHRPPPSFHERQQEIDDVETTSLARKPEIVKGFNFLYRTKRKVWNWSRIIRTRLTRLADQILKKWKSSTISVTRYPGDKYVRYRSLLSSCHCFSYHDIKLHSEFSSVGEPIFLWSLVRNKILRRRCRVSDVTFRCRGRCNGTATREWLHWTFVNAPPTKLSIWWPSQRQRRSCQAFSPLRPVHT